MFSSFFRNCIQFLIYLYSMQIVNNVGKKTKTGETHIIIAEQREWWMLAVKHDSVVVSSQCGRIMILNFKVMCEINIIHVVKSSHSQCSRLRSRMFLTQRQCRFEDENNYLNGSRENIVSYGFQMIPRFDSISNFNP